MRIRPDVVAYHYKSPPVQSINLDRLDGGLNLWDLEYKLKPNQSPNMLNMRWRDGALSSRRGQEYLYEGALGAVVASHERLFNGFVVFHAGTNLYKMNPDTGAYSVIKESIGTEVGGQFFAFGDYLYYKTRGVYLKITAEFVAEEVVGYVPLVAMNLRPDGTGGDLQQSENRLSKFKRFKYSADGTAKIYYVPIQGLDADVVPLVKVNGVLVTDFTTDYALGKLTFTTAPEQTNPITINNVEITVAKSDADTFNSIMDSRYAHTYGLGSDVGVVMAGSFKQTNAYFWSGVSLVADPSYFPFDYFNLAGQSDDAVTGFGKQQGLLMIFSERSIGKTNFTIDSISGRDFINLPYTPVNSRIGCDLPKTIQLVQNNLVFANTSGGVYMVRDTTIANENTVVGISRNINGSDNDPDRGGMLKAVRSVEPHTVLAFDDNDRYWVVADGEAYVWDYTLSDRVSEEETLSWFRFNNITANCYVRTGDDIIYGSLAGKWTRFVADAHSDYGEAIEKRYVFAVQYFGTYDRLKTVDKVIFSTRTDNFSTMDVTYRTDYLNRKDDTPVVSSSYTLVPRKLNMRTLGVIRFARSNIRKPGARHIRYFSVELYNNRKGSGMSLVSAQIFFNLNGEDR